MMNHKISGWDETFMQIAELIAGRHSTCVRIQVGALLVKDDRIISTGYNGVASKQRECNDFFQTYWKNHVGRVHPECAWHEEYPKWLESDEFKRMHREFSVKREIHAEVNCIAYAARQSIDITGAKMYCTWSPCINCAKLIIASGIKTYYYRNLYERKEDDGRELLYENKVSFYEIKASQ